jgi:hypothetical protein
VISGIIYSLMAIVISGTGVVLVLFIYEDNKLWVFSTTQIVAYLEPSTDYDDSTMSKRIQATLRFVANVYGVEYSSIALLCAIAFLCFFQQLRKPEAQAPFEDLISHKKET